MGSAAQGFHLGLAIGLRGGVTRTHRGEDRLGLGRRQVGTDQLLAGGRGPERGASEEQGARTAEPVTGSKCGRLGLPIGRQREDRPMASLRALALCCTLKKSPAPSSSDLIARGILTALADHDVAGDLCAWWSSPVRAWPLVLGGTLRTTTEGRDGLRFDLDERASSRALIKDAVPRHQVRRLSAS